MGQRRRNGHGGPQASVLVTASAVPPVLPRDSGYGSCHDLQCARTADAPLPRQIPRLLRGCSPRCVLTTGGEPRDPRTSFTLASAKDRTSRIRPRTSSGRRRNVMRTINWRMGGTLVLLVTLGSCAGSPATKEQVPRVYTECRCGTPEHDVLGCTHECCLGTGDCGNLSCTCVPRNETSKSARREAR